MRSISLFFTVVFIDVFVGAASYQKKDVTVADPILDIGGRRCPVRA